jgi:hypothetical protein
MSLASGCCIRVVDIVFVAGILFCVFISASAMLIVNFMCGTMDVEASHRFHTAGYIPHSESTRKFHTEIVHFLLRQAKSHA